MRRKQQDWAAVSCKRLIAWCATGPVAASSAARLPARAIGSHRCSCGFASLAGLNCWRSLHRPARQAALVRPAPSGMRAPTWPGACTWTHSCATRAPRTPRRGAPPAAATCAARRRARLRLRRGPQGGARDRCGARSETTSTPRFVREGPRAPPTARITAPLTCTRPPRRRAASSPPRRTTSRGSWRWRRSWRPLSWRTTSQASLAGALQAATRCVPLGETPSGRTAGPRTNWTQLAAPAGTKGAQASGASAGDSSLAPLPEAVTVQRQRLAAEWRSLSGAVAAVPPDVPLPPGPGLGTVIPGYGLISEILLQVRQPVGEARRAAS